MFNSSRLTVARKRRGLTKKQLCEATEVAPRTMTAYEAGEREPSDSVIDSLAAALKFPKGFFLADDLELPDARYSTFRAYSTITAGQRDAALGAGAIAMELNRWIAERFSLPSNDLPDLTQHDPETAAIALRATWQLGQRPVRNMVHLLEAHGVRVFSLSLDCDAVDAFSLWRDGVPFVFLNTRKSAERGRMDAAHELGHLVMHRGSEPGSKVLEDEAKRFAAAFLMPKESVEAAVTGLVTLSNLISWKRTWNVAVSALAHRIHDIGIINDWQYRLLCMHIGQAGYRRDEPDPIPRETSQVLEKVFQALRSEGIGKRDVASQLDLEPEDLESLVFGLVMLHLEGNAGAPLTGPRSSGPELKLVSGSE